MFFSHFSGIFMMSTLIMIGYSAIKKNKPVVFSQAILPGALSGFLWAIAQISFFVANQNLELVITFPIVSTGPGLIANLWGVLVFGEIKGRRNYLLLGLAFLIVFVAVGLIAASKF